MTSPTENLPELLSTADGLGGTFDSRLQLHETSGLDRADEPVVTGVCLPAGVALPETKWSLFDEHGVIVPSQIQTTRRHPDGSAHWLRLSWLAKVEGHKTVTYRLAASGRSSQADQKPSVVRTGDSGDSIVVRTGSCEFTFGASPDYLFQTAQGMGDQNKETSCSLVARIRGKRKHARICQVALADEGDVFTAITMHGQLGRRGPLRFSARAEVYAGRGLLKLELTLQNPQRARHPGGFWDLGDPGSVMLDDVHLQLDSNPPAREIRWVEDGLGPEHVTDDNWAIHQESSGGDHWNSRNHIDHTERMNLRYRGYRITTAGGQRAGLRASPCVQLVYDRGPSLGCALTEFWQRFPSSLSVDQGQLQVGLFPLSPVPHELQGGEQSTRCVWLDFESNEHPDKLTWTHQPLIPCPEHGDLGSTILFFPGGDCQTRREFDQLSSAALTGNSSFPAKREVIDEYGWRNFGDVWADHEEEHFDGLGPVISHYNNQYDLLQSLLVQFLNTADNRWWFLADPLARHIMDVDVYRTVHDKSTYCGGMFWHTAHYHDAGTSTHRSMSTHMRGKSMPAPGGGPGNEHLYSSGLLLYYYLTGNERARETVIGLADWVLTMDDGTQHLLGLVCDAPTGAASCTGDPSFHGPGRGAGNCINTLLDGWMATGSLRYLRKAETLVYRTVHPQDDIDALHLGHAESRWSYTVQLQALARLIQLTAHEASMDSCRRYARQTLLHYAQWMVQNERPYFDHPEQLEFPTETWAAQDLRKGNVLLIAAAYEPDATRRASLEQRGLEILDRAWATLMERPTCTYTRPMAIALQQGYIEAYFRSQSRQFRNGRDPDGNARLEGRCEFVPQKEHVRRQLRSPRGIARMLGHAFLPARWSNVVRRSWAGHQIRKLRGR